MIQQNGLWGCRDLAGFGGEGATKWSLRTKEPQCLAVRRKAINCRSTDEDSELGRPAGEYTREERCA
jgi:hypothetical protein